MKGESEEIFAFFSAVVVVAANELGRKEVAKNIFTEIRRDYEVLFAAPHLIYISAERQSSQQQQLGQRKKACLR